MIPLAIPISQECYQGLYSNLGFPKQQVALQTESVIKTTSK